MTKRAKETKEPKTRPQPPADGQPPSPAIVAETLALDSPSDLKAEILRLYREVTDGAMDSKEAGRRANLLQIAHNMHGSELHATVKALEKRLIEAGYLPKRVEHAA